MKQCKVLGLESHGIPFCNPYFWEAPPTDMKPFPYTWEAKVTGEKGEHSLYCYNRKSFERLLEIWNNELWAYKAI